MPGPWEQYQSQAPPESQKPWEKYGGQGDLLVKPGSGTPSRPNVDLPADLPAKAGRAALKMLPAAGAVAATVAGPEAWPAAIGMAALGGAGGEAVKQGIESATGMPERPRSIAEAARNVASSGVEQAAYEAGGRILGAGARVVADKLNPTRLYQSALKPSTTLKVPERDKLIQTGLNERIPVSKGGFNKAVGITDDLNEQIAAKVRDESERLGPVIDPRDVAARVDQLTPTFKQQVNPASDLAALKSSKAQFLNEHTDLAPYTKIAPSVEEPGAFAAIGKGETKIAKPMTISEAQAEKQGTYRQLRKKYGELGSADTESQKALARGLKEEIVSRVPALQAMNDRDGAMIALEESLSKFVGSHGNKNVLGLIPTIVGTAGGMATGHGAEGGAAGALGTLAVMAMDNPAIKSRIAIAMNQVAKSKAAGVAANVGRKIAPAVKVGLRGQPWTWGDNPQPPSPLE